MIKWIETRSWEESLYSVIPKRKFQIGTCPINEDSEADPQGGDANKGKQEKENE